MEGPTQQGIDSKALLTVYIRKLPLLILLMAAGAVFGSALHLIAALAGARSLGYVSETEYYIEFAPGRYEARDYYNAFTWNDVMATDPIMDRVMTILGDGHDRDQVKEMITAEILSDVRYLTITVRGPDKDQVDAVRDALRISLEAFGAQKREFDEIYLIEELETVREQPQLFTGRAALLGAFLWASVGVFMIALRFSVGSAFYTRRDIMQGLGLPVYGMTFGVGHGKKDGADSLIQGQARMLASSLQRLTSQEEEIFLLDGSDGRYAGAFLAELREGVGVDTSGMKVYETGQQTDKGVILAVVPFGTACRERIVDAMACAGLWDARIVGAVLVGVDRAWARIYYGVGRSGKGEVPGRTADRKDGQG